MAQINKKTSILLADDHEVVRRGVRGLLQAQGSFQVVGEAANGRKALELAQKLRPNVAILDIGMPEMDGLEVTRRIRESVPETNVLILTMHESDEMVRQVLNAGAHGFVLKSDLAHCLLKVIRAVARSEISLTPKVSEIVLNGFMNIGKSTVCKGDSQAQPTAREVEIIRLLASGNSNKQVAETLGITVKTADTYRSRIMLKLHFHSVSDLVRFAVRENFIKA